MANKTPIGIDPHSLLGFIIKMASILALILFALTLSLLNKNQSKILEDRGVMIEALITAYALLVAWAIFEIRYKLIGFVPDGAFCNQ
jgi:hypothetical protein